MNRGSRVDGTEAGPFGTVRNAEAAMQWFTSGGRKSDARIR